MQSGTVLLKMFRPQQSAHPPLWKDRTACLSGVSLLISSPHPSQGNVLCRPMCVHNGSCATNTDDNIITKKKKVKICTKTVANTTEAATHYTNNLSKKKVGVKTVSMADSHSRSKKGEEGGGVTGRDWGRGGGLCFFCLRNCRNKKIFVKKTVASTPTDCQKSETESCKIGRVALWHVFVMSDVTEMGVGPRPRYRQVIVPKVHCSREGFFVFQVNFLYSVWGCLLLLESLS